VAKQESSARVAQPNNLNPAEISNHQFKKSMFGGFKKHVVQSYLQDVGSQVKALQDERSTLASQVASQQDELRQMQEQMGKQRRRIEQHEKKLAEFRQAEQSLRSALVSSQKFAEDLLETSRREADSIVESARLEKARVRLEAKELSISLTKEVRALQEQRQRLYAEMGAILDTHKNLLEKYTGIQAVDIALPEPEDEQKSLGFSHDAQPEEEDAAAGSFGEDYDDEDEEEEWASTPEVMPHEQPLSGFGDAHEGAPDRLDELGEGPATP
jgi:cell division septum initiation protein DivIVA